MTEEHRGKRHHRWDGHLGEHFPKVHCAFWFGFMVGFLFFPFLFSTFIFEKGQRKECQKGMEACWIGSRSSSTCDRRCWPSLPSPPCLHAQTGCHQSPPSWMLLKPSLTQNSPSSSFQIRRAWSGCCRPGSGWGDGMFQGFPKTWEDLHFSLLSALECGPMWPALCSCSVSYLLALLFCLLASSHHNSLLLSRMWYAAPCMKAFEC